MSVGHAVIGGVRFEVTGVSLAGGEVKISILLPPGPAVSGPITVFGTDGQGIGQGKTVKVPAHTSVVMFDYGLRISEVSSANESVNLADLPGWP